MAEAVIAADEGVAETATMADRFVPVAASTGRVPIFFLPVLSPCSFYLFGNVLKSTVSQLSKFH